MKNKKQIKVIYFPNQYDPKAFDEGCDEILKIIAETKGNREEGKEVYAT